ncbi:MAG: hypothetical protein IV086_04185 [Hyphomonadaceae bacterium]|nr:MAG: hypothetical protein FD160_2223 [Caulobacteraceae bacterium]MBT9444882.1 hypothetical protein [Hyphomonadaceae bacterium]TPW03463.1 MAG: hypothetical protein FD124_2998 [Alphaproteobacteria bacterium]
MKPAFVPLLAVAAFATCAGAAFALAPSPAVETRAARGFVLAPPVLSEGAQGLNLRGGVCRTSQSALRPVAIRLERLDAQGVVLATRTTPVSGALSPRSRGCAFYSARTDWRASADETLRVTALTAPDLDR